MIVHRPPTARIHTVRRAFVLFLALTTSVALLAACGEDQLASTDTTVGDSGDGQAVTGSDLDDVEVVETEGEPPVLEFDMPFGVDETTTRVITEGDGAAITEGVTANFDFLFVNATDGTQLGTSYDSEPMDVIFEKELMAGIYQGLDGQKAGSLVLVAIAPADGPGADENGLTDSDSLLFLADIHDVRTPLARAEGTSVAPVDGLPTVVLAADGAPTITVPAGEPPSELIVQPLIEGTGAVVESGQTITVHYTGVLHADGSVFDSSWTSGTPASFPIGTGGVIPGWDKGLVGQAVGSQILLVIPAVDGYGDTGSGESIPPGAALVFVVDILDAA